MSRFGLMVDRHLDPASTPVLVDLGYARDKAARTCADRLMKAGVGRRCFSIEGAGRLLVKLPAKRADNIVKRFRFVKATTYWQCTHCRSALAGTLSPETEKDK